VASARGRRTQTRRYCRMRSRARGRLCIRTTNTRSTPCTIS
jgi:hypothetical protein